MKTQIAPASSVADPGGFTPPRTVAPVAATPSELPAHQTADLRLVIEEDEATGTIVYMTLDRRTGEVVRQLPREEVLRLRDMPSYEPGEIADSRS